ncbi:hypothetical protein D917_09228 [Trichinella nativa]|uniref:Ribosomal RNA-processing protein 14/surfeit locus protein 6 C-terminal domain-containing protein n=1 Tax=Trichinella nativa TaxID=6335 RepID=A0A1Y3EMJ0_9BILA|nr:hypothetical protein D917_09228 [Trichinella nativa]
MENSDNNDLLKSVEELDDYFQNAIDLIHPDHYGFDSSIVYYLRDDRIARANAMSKNGKRVSRAKWENLKYLNDHFCYTVSSIWEKLEKANPEKLLESEENMIDQKQLKKFEKWEKLTEESKKDDAIMQKLKYKKISKKSNKKRANVKKENAEKFTGRDYARLLEKVERRQQKLQELEKNDPKKAETVKQQFIWDSADDRNMLKKGLKMKEKRKASKKKKWQERKEAVARVNKKKQDVRQANIQQRVEQKKKKRLAEARKRKGKC